MQNITVKGVLAGTFAFLAMCCVIRSAYAATPERNAYFGDTHIHTISFVSPSSTQPLII